MADQGENETTDRTRQNSGRVCISNSQHLTALKAVFRKDIENLSGIWEISNFEN